MRGFEQKREGEGAREGFERVNPFESKIKVIELVYGLEIKLIGVCGYKKCKKRYDLTESLLGSTNGAVNFSKSCQKMNFDSREPKRVKPIFDSRLCWQELNYNIEYSRIGEGVVSECRFWKVSELRKKILDYIHDKPEEIKQKKPDLYFSVILNYGSFNRAFADIGQKYKMKWPNYEQLVDDLLKEKLTNYYIAWITGSDVTTIEKRRKGRKTI
ncbi:MAG: hypothetical protein ACOZAR_00355 [Patescibacteria group bacterium]